MLPEIKTPIPGPRSVACAEKLSHYEAREVTYLAKEFPIFWERAEGSNVWDVDGNRFLDFTSAFAVASLGHSAAPVRKALEEQAPKLLHAMGDVHPAALKADLCEALSAATFERWGVGPGKTLLCNSGSEAVEAALKTVVLHGGKPGVISFTGGYHGTGFGALEATAMPYFRTPFQSQLARFGVQLPFPNSIVCPHGTTDAFRHIGGQFPHICSECLEDLGEQIESTIRKREIGAIIVEPVQGRGGEVVPPRDFLPMLRRICDEHKILLIFDEIYTGFNRTGKLFACEHFEVVPDLVCLGKGLTGGFPLSACTGRSDVMDAWPASQGEALHTFTMLGNPLGCAMALASIAEHLKPETQKAARSAGRRLREALESLRSPHIGEVRGLGAMLGIELVDERNSPHAELSAKIMIRSLQDGLILLGGGASGNVLSFSPSFFVTDEEIAYLRGKLQEYLTSLPGSVS